MMNTKRARRDFKEMERRRRKGMRLSGEGKSQAEAARRCEASRTTAMRWERARGKGKQAWKRRTLGRPRKVTAPHLRAPGTALGKGTQAHGFLNDRWTLPRVAHVLEGISGVRCHPVPVWKLLGRMGWSCQKPEGRAAERDEKAIARWKRHTWPTLKKSPPRRPDPRLRGRKRIERAPIRFPRVGAQGADPATDVQFQLGQTGRHRRRHLAAVLLPTLSRRHPLPAGRRFPAPLDAAASRRPPGDLGRTRRPSQPLRPGLHPEIRRAIGPGPTARLCARTQSDGIRLGPSEKPCPGQLLSPRLAASDRRSPAEVAQFPKARLPRAGLLETSRAFFATKCHSYMQVSIEYYKTKLPGAMIAMRAV